MTDDEILAHYRNKHGNPYMSELALHCACEEEG
jgi:hypothetical protein